MSTYVTGINAALQLGGTWTDITAYLHNRANPAWSAVNGRQDEISQITPSSLTGELKNTDARFTIRNPTGPYYGQIGRNTPIRLSVPGSGTYLRMEDDSSSSASCPDASGLHITGSIDVRLDMQLSGYNTTFLAGKWVGPSEMAWALTLNDDGTLSFFWSTTGSNFQSLGSTQPVPLGRVVVRVTLNASTGAVTFYTAAAGNADTGPFTQLGDVPPPVGSTSIFAATSFLFVGTGNGAYYEFEVRNGIGGTVVAHPVFSSQTAGATSFTDAQSNTWQVNGTAELSNRSYRGHYELSSVPVQWEKGNRDIWVALQAGGQLRRLQQGNAPVLSPMTRAVQQLPNLVAAWPCEDATRSTQFASLVPGANAMTFTGVPTLATDSTFACSSALPTIGTSIWSGVVPSGATWNDNVVRFLLHETAGTIPDGTVLLSVYTTGIIARADLAYHTSSGGTLGLNCFNAAGTSLSALIIPGMNLDGGQCRISVNIRTAGAPSGQVAWQIEKVAVGDTGATVGGADVPGVFGAVTQVVVNPNAANLGSTVMGQFTVATVWDTLFDVLSGTTTPAGRSTGPLAAWSGETAGRRFIRLCGENGINPRVYGFPATTVPMGIQAIDTLPNLLQQVEDTDRGLLYEPRECLGIGYRTLGSMTGQSPALTLNYAAAQAGDQEARPVSLSPTSDDLFTTNSWVLSNVDGSSATATLDDGSAMSVGTIGEYQNTKTVSAWQDNLLSDIAGWMLHISTCAEERYPQVLTGLHNPAIVAAGLRAAILGVRIGDVVQISNPPAQVPPGPLRMLVTGASEPMNSYLHPVAWNTVPASPYDISVSDVTGAAVDTDASVLAAAVNSSATSLSILTTAGYRPWDSSGVTPFDINIGGERMTVTAVGAAARATDGTFESGVTGWAVNSGTLVQTNAHAHSGTFSAEVTITGTPTQEILRPTGEPVIPGAPYIATTWVFTTAWPTWQAAIDWYTSNPNTGGTYISTTSGGSNTLSTFTWTRLQAIGNAPANATWCQYGPTALGSPTTSDFFYVDDVTLQPPAWVQTFTVTRSVNGVTKSQAAGAAVSLWTPPIVALT